MEQFERAERYLQKIKNIYHGKCDKILGRNTKFHDPHYEDEILSFFMHCYHIKDWIEHLNKNDLKKKEIESFINKNQCLKICADLCNGTKHCKLTRHPRSGKEPYIASGTLSEGNWTYEIAGPDQLHDALALAIECMDCWRHYIHDQNIRPKDQ